jgi:hypothetical protein
VFESPSERDAAFEDVNYSAWIAAKIGTRSAGVLNSSLRFTCADEERQQLVIIEGNLQGKGKESVSHRILVEPEQGA